MANVARQAAQSDGRHHYFRAVEELIEGESWKAEWDLLPLLIGGKSMGGRVAAMLANDEDLNLAVKGVVAFGYPFHPIGKSEPENWRLEPLEKSLLPILVCQGERDDFGWWDEFDTIELPQQVTLEWITDGSHDLGPTGKSEATLKSNLNHAARAAAEFCANPPILTMEFWRRARSASTIESFIFRQVVLLPIFFGNNHTPTTKSKSITRLSSADSSHSNFR